MPVRVAAIVAFLMVLMPDATSAQAAALVKRARDARFQQDSALASYRVISRQRMSAWIGLTANTGFGAIGPQRLAARVESVARIGWDHRHGAWGEIIAARSVAPIVGETEMHSGADDIALVLPYYPGRDRLWPVAEVRAMLPRSEEWIVHPFDPGADSLYLFSLGDSMSFRLPDGGQVRVRELRMRPRRPAAQLVVGSLWVDVESGSLVRAAYRPSTPMDLWPLMEGEVQRQDRDKVRKFGPFTGLIREVVVEHSLHEGRFWLPRTRIVSAEGSARMGRIALSIEQTFRYENVSALGVGERSAHREPEPDVDPRTGRVRRPVWRNVEERTPRCRERGDSSARWSTDSIMRDDRLTTMIAEGVRFRVLLPCDHRDLVESPELPESIYDPSERLFTDTDLGALRKDVEQSLSITSQAQWQPQKPTFQVGLERGMLRYNRVEGLSAGIGVERLLGAGYTASGSVRLGIADLYPNMHAALERSNVRNAIRVSAYRQLVSATDWGNPFGVGASAFAVVFGRDDGFYYRALGGDVSGTRRTSNDGAVLAWRAFAERHTSATVETHESLARAINGTRFQPNIPADAGVRGGAAASLSYVHGADPTSRLSGALRVEGAAVEADATRSIADRSYGRVMMEHTLLQGLGRGILGSLTGAAGTSSGALPAQRLWYVGGAYTVRGYRPAEMAGDAFWIGRAEIAKGHPLIRPSLFADVGWAGSRSDWARQSAPIAGVGIGASAMQGLARLDVSRGLHRDRLWRVDVYLEVR